METKNEDIKVNIIGAGLAGSECAYILSKYGIKVKLYEMKKLKKTPAHTSNNFGELVCSNSLKSESITNACGLLKEEMRLLGSLLVEVAYATRVPAGQALAVDRIKFEEYITKKIYDEKNIEVIDVEIENIDELEDIVVIATGPLTSEALSLNISKLLRNVNLYFYDAVAPIILAESINMDIAYVKDRYGELGVGDYINLPLTKEEYFNLYNSLISAKRAKRHDFDKLEYFEGCMPIEELARRGDKTLVFGPMKPVGLEKGDEKRPYAVVQLRAENVEKTMYNLVGFQTSLSFPEQDKIFKMIPGLQNAEFIRYGVMHRNTYLDAPKALDRNFKLKDIKDKSIYFAGQISGVEGYVESAASGLMVAYNIIASLNKKNIDNIFPDDTMLGSLAKHISTENKNFQPMNANFGIVPPLKEKIKDKKLKYEKYAKRSLESMEVVLNEFKNIRR